MRTSTLRKQATSIVISALMAALSLTSYAQAQSQGPTAAQADKQAEKQDDKYDKKDAKDNKKAQQQQERRISQQQQQERIRQQQQEIARYNQRIAQQQAIAQRNAQQLQQQKRMAQYHYQQAYYEHLRQQRARMQNVRYDYDNDPFYYTPASYRYRRGDNDYQTNQYGAEVLRRALNYGYQEGYQAGRADKQDNWRFDFNQSFAYQDANYGYDGRYVRQDDYNHYFREGFQRGYQDGYHKSRQYGRNENGSDSLLGAVIDSILKLQPLQ